MMFGLDASLFQREMDRQREITTMRREKNALMDDLARAQMQIMSMNQELATLRHENFKLQAKLITEEGISTMRENMIEFYRKLIIPSKSAPTAGTSGPGP